MAKVLMLNIFGMEKQNAELIHFSNVANELARIGNTVVLFHVSLKGRPAIRTIISRNIVMQEVFIWGRSYLLFITALMKSFTFIKTVQQLRPDIVYVRLGLFTALYVIMLRLFLGHTVKIMTEHNGWIGPELKMAGYNSALISLGEFLQRKSALYSDRVRAVSNGIREYLISLGVNETMIFIAGNGTDIDFFRPLGTPPAYDIGFIGNLAKWQGIEWLIDSLAFLKKENFSVSLAIAGTGQEADSLRGRIHDYALSDHISMLGSIPYDNVPQVINQCRICVSLKLDFSDSRKSSVAYSYSPLKIRDYAACGKPIIASRLPGLEEIEEARFGILVQPGDIAGLASAMRNLIDNPDLCDEMGRNARAYAEQQYSWEHTAHAISRNIADLLSSP